MRKRWKRFGVALLVVLAAGAAWFALPEELFWPELRVAGVGPPVPIRIGENVQISKPHDQFPFDECVAAADPNRPNRLFAASMYWPHGDGQSIAGYLSDDGGATWVASLNPIADRPTKERLNDPTAAFGPAGELYFAHMRYEHAKADELGGRFIGTDGAGALDWLRLPAGGTTAWETTGRIARVIDRPWLAVDHSRGPHRGTIHCAASVSAPHWIRSADGGRTFDFPPLSADSRVTPVPAQPVVLGDGTVLTAFRCLRDGQHVASKLRFQVFTSTDGGRTTRRAAAVGSLWKHPRHESNLGSLAGIECPQLAVDPGSGAFADRLYCVWSESVGQRRESQRVILSRSCDRGGTWTDPVILSEHTLDPLQPDYAAFMPCVAVNKDGAVAVSWYDRRGMLPVPPPPGGPRGWNVRLRVSLDGGETWAPSVQVNSAPAVGPVEVGHTAGLVADAGGRFHPVWIDDRTGKGQVWTATVEVGDVSK